GSLTRDFQSFFFKISGPRQIPSWYLLGCRFSISKQRALAQLAICRKSLRERRERESARRSLSGRFLLTGLGRLVRSRLESPPGGIRFAPSLQRAPILN